MRYDNVQICILWIHVSFAFGTHVKAVTYVEASQAHSRARIKVLQTWLACVVTVRLQYLASRSADTCTETRALCEVSG